MSKLKIKSGLIGVLLLAGLLAGWETMLIVAVLILLFCEINENIKKIMISVISFFIGITLVSLLWQIISEGIGVVIYVFNKFIEFLNYYLTNPINISKLTNYVFSPIQNVVSTFDEVIKYLLIIAKFCFVIGTLAKKTINIPIISKYVDKALNYVNATDSAESNNNQSTQTNNTNQNNNFVNQPINNNLQFNNNQQFVNNPNQQMNPNQFNNNNFVN